MGRRVIVETRAIEQARVTVATRITEQARTIHGPRYGHERARRFS
jgi:hypothetical protein